MNTDPGFNKSITFQVPHVAFALCNISLLTGQVYEEQSVFTTPGPRAIPEQEPLQPVTLTTIAKDFGLISWCAILRMMGLSESGCKELLSLLTSLVQPILRDSSSDVARHLTSLPFEPRETRRNFWGQHELQSYI